MGQCGAQIYGIAGLGSLVTRVASDNFLIDIPVQQLVVFATRPAQVDLIDR